MITVMVMHLYLMCTPARANWFVLNTPTDTNSGAMRWGCGAPAPAAPPCCKFYFDLDQPTIPNGRVARVKEENHV